MSTGTQWAQSMMAGYPIQGTLEQQEAFVQNMRGLHAIESAKWMNSSSVYKAQAMSHLDALNDELNTIGEKVALQRRLLAEQKAVQALRTQAATAQRIGRVGNFIKQVSESPGARKLAQYAYEHAGTIRKVLSGATVLGTVAEAAEGPIEVIQDYEEIR